MTWSQFRSAVEQKRGEEIRSLDDGPGCRLGKDLQAAVVGIEIGVPTVSGGSGPGS